MNLIKLFVLMNLLFLAKAAFSIPLIVSPTSALIKDCQIVEFEVQGGTPPYAVTATGGEVTKIVDSEFTFIPPDIETSRSSEFINVYDSSDNEKSIRVIITNSKVDDDDCAPPKITPKAVTTIIGNNKSLEFKVIGGIKPFKFIASEGRVEVKAATVLYYPPAKIGKYQITVYDHKNKEGSAEINVISVPVLTPGKAVLFPNQSIPLKVSGGNAPYNWSADAGQLSAVEGNNVIYAAPNNTGLYTVAVMDQNGFNSMTQIQVIIPGKLACGPTNNMIAVGEPIDLAIAYGLAPYTWQDGYQGRTHQMTFNQVGKNKVEVRDAQGTSCNVEVNVINGGLPITPAIVYLKPGEQTNFAVTGLSQYTWTAEAGSLTTLEGPQVKYIAPDQPGSYHITVTDQQSQSQGIAVAIVTAPLTGPGEVRNETTIDNISRVEAKIMVDKNALVDLKFIINIPNDPQEIYNIYAAVMLTQADTPPLLLFIANNQMVALSDPFPVYKSSAKSGQSVSINVFQGVITQLLEQFNIPIADKVKLDYFIGYRPVAATGLDKLIFNPVPYSLEIQ
ncbi:hypothetical protein [Candidatus Marithrix sp. Canyon 246]|uniref:hypothetical protein n=1 Tax=Candidatus Marithrix sp. Canyon 246 TaxID=1827136 RepID=UPI000849F65B|nr:hypothetical protein [Candidatus Marithrix sp. Canyon 246]